MNVISPSSLLVQWFLAAMPIGVVLVLTVLSLGRIPGWPCRLVGGVGCRRHRVDAGELETQALIDDTRAMTPKDL